MIDTIHIAVCMKPIEGNFAQNALEHGVAGLNIGASRVGTEQRENRPAGPRGKGVFGDGGQWDRQEESQACEGRFPSNVILDGSKEVLEQFPETSTHAGEARANHKAGMFGIVSKKGKVLSEGDSGSAARFFKQCNPEDEDERTNQ